MTAQSNSNSGGAAPPMPNPMDTDELRRMLDAATPGPWNWEVNRRHKKVELSGGKQTKAGGDLTVLSFTRWGLQGAAPVFWTWHGNVADEPQRADEIAVAAPGRDHHADWFARIEHPDARLIALAPQLAAENLALRADLSALRAREAEMRAEIERLRRNNDMWRGQCERQAVSLTEMRAALRGLLSDCDLSADRPQLIAARAALSQPDSGEGAA